MRIKTKQEILDFLISNDDGTDQTKELIRLMENECRYADVDCFSISYDDLNSLGDKAKDKIKGHFGKTIDELTPENYQEIADAMAETVEDEYSENLYTTIEYGL